MKKTLLAGVLGLATMAPAQALIIDLDAGFGTWLGNYDGHLGDESFDVSDTLGLETTSTPTHAFVEFRHPVPVLPNFRAAYTQVKSEGVGELEKFQFGEVFDGQVTTSLDLTHFDTNLFYELTMIPYLALQAGIGARFYQGGIDVTGEVESVKTTERLAMDEFPLPQVSLGARFDIPLSDFYVNARADGLAYKNSQLLDWSLGAGYEVDLIPMFDLRLEAGWRELRFALDPRDFNNDDISNTVDTRLSGAYFNAGIVF